MRSERMVDATGSKRGRTVRPRGGLLRVLLLVVVAAWSAACSDADPAGPAGPVGVAAVEVSPATAELVVGSTMDLRAVVRSAQGDSLTGRPVTWSSSDTLRARVSMIGRVTGMSAGNVEISATSGGRTGRATLTIRTTQAVPAIAAVEPATIPAGGPAFSLTILGTGFGVDSRLQWNDVARPTEYVSATELRATIGAGDIAAVGSARIRVVTGGTSPGQSNELVYAIVVQTVPVASVHTNVALSIAAVGQLVPLQATTKDAAGRILSGRLVTWTSSNQLVATVNGTGLVNAVGEGEVMITASSEGRTTTVALTVTPRPYNLVFDESSPALSIFDMRLGGAPVQFWQHNASMRAIEPSISPDRRWYAYTIEMGGRRDIAILDIVNRTYQWITADGTSDQPEWSPAGDRIVFRSDRGGRSDIWTMAHDGTNLVNVTATMPSTLAAQDPTWSPDGLSIAFAARLVTGARSLYVIRPDGSAPRRIDTGSVSATQPSWMFDDLVFTGGDMSGRTDLWRVSASGLGAPLFKLTNTGDASMPAWSPDGRWIAFVQRPGGAAGRIMAMQPIVGEVRPVFTPAGPNGASNPTWLRSQ